MMGCVFIKLPIISFPSILSAIQYINYYVPGNFYITKFCEKGNCDEYFARGVGLQQFHKINFVTKLKCVKFIKI